MFCWNCHFWLVISKRLSPKINRNASKLIRELNTLIYILFTIYLIYLVIEHFKEVARCEELVFNCFPCIWSTTEYLPCVTMIFRSKSNIGIRIFLVFPHGLENKRRHHNRSRTINTYVLYLRRLCVEVIWQTLKLYIKSSNIKLPEFEIIKFKFTFSYHLSIVSRISKTAICMVCRFEENFCIRPKMVLIKRRRIR